MITDANGQEVARHDYLPFGEEWASTSYSNIENPLKYAGLERDTETGLDYALARYCRQQSGRFTQADDPVYGDPFDPQSAQLYGYVSNNPLRWIDPSGHERDCPSDACVEADDPFKRLQRFALEMWQFSQLFLTPPPPQSVSNAHDLSGQLKSLDLMAGSPFMPPMGRLFTAYRSMSLAGRVQYAGFTSNFARRAAEHLRGKGTQVERVMSGLSRSDARAVEQALIEIHGLGKHGGTLLNRINSIATSNPAYADQLQRGDELLKTIGYR